MWSVRSPGKSSPFGPSGHTDVVTDDPHSFVLSATSDDPTASDALEETQPPAALRELLAEVEAAFAELGGPERRWPDPHVTADGGLRAPLDEEYSRTLEPGKYAILWVRADAWRRALVGRGWAEAAEVDGPDVESWLGEHVVAPASTTVLRPHRAGAVPLRLARTVTDTELCGLLVGVGEPAVGVRRLPECGCDACDDGSAALLESLDEVVLAVVEGALEVSWDGRGHRLRMPESASWGGEDPGFSRPFRVAAGPWAGEWTPRPLIALD